MVRSSTDADGLTSIALLFYVMKINEDRLTNWTNLFIHQLNLQLQSCMDDEPRTQMEKKTT